MDPEIYRRSVYSGHVDPDTLEYADDHYYIDGHNYIALKVNMQSSYKIYDDSALGFQYRTTF